MTYKISELEQWFKEQGYIEVNSNKDGNITVSSLIKLKNEPFTIPNLNITVNLIYNCPYTELLVAIYKREDKYSGIIMFSSDKDKVWFEKIEDLDKYEVVSK